MHPVPWTATTATARRMGAGMVRLRGAGLHPSPPTSVASRSTTALPTTTPSRSTWSVPPLLSHRNPHPVTTLSASVLGGAGSPIRANVGALQRRSVTISAPGAGGPPGGPNQSSPTVSASSKHPYGASDDGIRDPAAGPNSRPEGSGGGGGSGSSAGSGVTSSSGDSAAATPSKPSTSSPTPTTSTLTASSSSAIPTPIGSSSDGSNAGTNNSSSTPADAETTPRKKQDGQRSERLGLRDPSAGPNSRPDMGMSASAATAEARTGDAKTEPTAEPQRPEAAASAPPSGTPQSPPTSISEPSTPPASSPTTPTSPTTPGSSPTSPTNPPPVPTTPLPRNPHPFHTYTFVRQLESSGLPPATARALMEGVRGLIVTRSESVRANMLSVEDLDNWGYHFKAALSELRTEQGIRTRNDGVALRSTASAMRREVDGLEQGMKVDLQEMRHEIEMDINDRKAQTRVDMKRFDLATEDVNNKFTIHLGDLRTAIEGSKWESTRRAIAIIVVLVALGVALSTIAASSAASTPPPATSPPAPAAPQPAPTMRDMGVGTSDDDEQHRHEQDAHVERRLEQIMKDWRPHGGSTSRSAPRESRESQKEPVWRADERI